MAERPALQLVPAAEPERPEEVTEVVTLGDVFEDLRFHLADAARTAGWRSPTFGSSATSFGLAG